MLESSSNPIKINSPEQDDTILPADNLQYSFPSKECYWELININKEETTVVKKKLKVNRIKLWKMPSKISISPYPRKVLWRLSHDSLATADKLAKWKKNYPRHLPPM